jgi:hypothetical protein
MSMIGLIVPAAAPPNTYKASNINRYNNGVCPESELDKKRRPRSRYKKTEMGNRFA